MGCFHCPQIKAKSMIWGLCFSQQTTGFYDCGLQLEKWSLTPSDVCWGVVCRLGIAEWMPTWITKVHDKWVYKGSLSIWIGGEWNHQLSNWRHHVDMKWSSWLEKKIHTMTASKTTVRLDQTSWDVFKLVSVSSYAVCSNTISQNRWRDCPTAWWINHQKIITSLSCNSSYDMFSTSSRGCRTSHEQSSMPSRQSCARTQDARHTENKRG